MLKIEICDFEENLLHSVTADNS